MIVVIDYNAGNIKSVTNAFESIGQKVIVSNQIKDIENSDAIVIPGVGAFGYAIKSLRDINLIDTLNEQVLVKKKPYLGICLGLQFLANTSNELGEHKGFGWIDGWVKILEPLDYDTSKLPHIGWNNVEIIKKDPLFEGIENNTDFYFLHSYVISCKFKYITSTCYHGETFISSIQKDNIFGVQFHPEKSQKAGIQLLKNFCKVI